jgi:hypothetical protein
MNITNVHGLPASIVAAVQNDPYQGGGDISCTKLIDAPKISELSRRHRDQITVDVSERVWALLGQAVHTILERAGLRQEGMVAEERLFAEVNGWQVSGQFDSMDLMLGHLADYKVTTTFKSKGSDKWVQQLNVLRWLAHQNGYTVNSLSIIAIFRDWRKVEAQRNTRGDYPPAAIQEIHVPLWSLEETEDYIYERVALHQAARKGTDIPCSDEERWYDRDTWALMKPQAKRALRVFDTEAEAQEHKLTNDGYVIVKRHGEYKRCATYCDVSAFCQQWAATKQQIKQESGL